MPALRLILGDQLSTQLTSLRDADPKADTILMCEVREEATYVRHHKKKIALLFSAMRHFAKALRAKGFTVRYVPLTDPDNTHSFEGEVKRALQANAYDRLVLTHPGEVRVLEMMRAWRETLEIDVEIREDDRFLCPLNDFAQWAEGRKELRMEFFYREMRKRHDILMDSGKPVGGKWNYDQDNRKPPKDGLTIPPPTRFEPDEITQEVLSLVADEFGDHFGTLEPFAYAVTAEQAQTVLSEFIEHRLPKFGDFQDAMISGEPWMFHAHISFYLNCGLLSPDTCIAAAIKAYERGHAPLNAVEGFVRQILGWREFVRGLYWLKMPDYAQQNALGADRPLPWFYWDGKTEMNCLRQCIHETRDHAYAHHIQRLMVLGNFALLAGLDPREVNEWYLIVYADAYEWVELPNVTGMVLYADGGVLASKPYAAGGSYINKMSDYCQDCRYDVKEKTGKTACPFNYLYWDFLARHQETLGNNPRLGMVYRTWERFDADHKQAVRASAQAFFQRLEASEV